jgi:mRNA-degrading endonuclease RelE of RelBE toxin-antitoxin system
MSDSGIKLADLFSAVNRKDRDWWERLSDEQRKKFSSWLYSRYMSIVRHNNPDMHRYYVLSANKELNRDLSKLTKNHTKLIYLLMTTMANEFTRADHQYIPPLKKNKADKKTNNKMRVLSELHPGSKDSDIETLANVITDEEFEELLVSHGWDIKKIKAELKK